MAGKKKANTAYITSPEKTRYSGFVEEARDFTDAVKEMNLENRITSVTGQLREMQSRIKALPDNKTLHNTQAAVISKLIDQLQRISQFAAKVNEKTTGEKAPLSRLMNWKATDPASQEYKASELVYESCTNDLMGLVKDSMALFCGGNAAGFPTNIKINLDLFNLSDGYKEFTTENSVMSLVDQIFTDVSGLYTKTVKIITRDKRHKKEKELEVSLDYDKKNLEAFGKKCLEDPNYSLKAVRDAFKASESEYTEAKNAERKAETDYLNAEKAYKKAKDTQTKLISREASQNEKLQKAEDDYAAKAHALEEAKAAKKAAEEAAQKAKAELDKAAKAARAKAEKAARERAKKAAISKAENTRKEKIEQARTADKNNILLIKNALDSISFPDLDELHETLNKKRKTYMDYLEPNADQLTKLAEGESQTKNEIEALNEKIKAANKSNKKIEAFVNAEAERSCYLNYPEFARKLKAQIKNLPANYYIDCDSLNAQQINAQIERMIKSKRTELGVWDPIKGMLDHVKKFCPRKYRTEPLSDKVLNRCEEEAKLVCNKLDNDDLHKTIKEYKTLKTEIEKLKLEKKLSTGKNTFSKKKESELKRKEKQLEAIKKGGIYIEGASTVEEWTKQSVNLASVVFDYNNSQTDFYMIALKKTAADEDKQNESIHQSHQQIYNKLLEIKNSIPADAIKSSGMEPSLKAVLSDMELLLATETTEILRQEPHKFEEAYLKFREAFHSIKDQNDKQLQNINTKEYKVEDESLFDPEFEAEAADITKDPEYIRDIKAIKTEIDAKYINDIKAKTEGLKKAEDAYKIAEKKRDTTVKEKSEFDKQLQKATSEKTATEETLSNAKSDFEAKQLLAAQSKNKYDRAGLKMTETDVYFRNKQAAEGYDAANEELSAARYNIDKNGDSFFQLIRQPFHQYLDRKDFAKKKKHGDSTEYKDMISRLVTLVSLPSETSIETYKTAIENVKTFAQTYVSERESQFFVNKRNPMRKYRLSYAKGLISLCDEQLQGLDGSERTIALNPEVEKYLGRKKKVTVKQLNEKETNAAKTAYNDTLDARKNEAINAYKNSVEYKGRKASEGKNRKSIRELREEEELLLKDEEKREEINLQNSSQNRTLQQIPGNNINISVDNSGTEKTEIITSNRKRIENYN